MKVLFLLFTAALFSRTQGPFGLPVAGPALVANMQRPLIPLSRGARIQPLCNPALPASCLAQWTHQARPLALGGIGEGVPAMQYFLPSLLADSYLPAPAMEDSEDWELYNLTMPSSRVRTGRSRRYYTSRTKPSRIRRVDVDEKGKVTAVTEGELAFVPASAIKVTEVKKAVETGPVPPAQKPEEGGEPPPPSKPLAEESDRNAEAGAVAGADRADAEAVVRPPTAGSEAASEAGTPEGAGSSGTARRESPPEGRPSDLPEGSAAPGKDRGGGVTREKGNPWLWKGFLGRIERYSEGAGAVPEDRSSGDSLSTGGNTQVRDSSDPLTAQPPTPPQGGHPATPSPPEEDSQSTPATPDSEQQVELQVEITEPVSAVSGRVFSGAAAEAEKGLWQCATTDQSGDSRFCESCESFVSSDEGQGILEDVETIRKGIRDVGEKTKKKLKAQLGKKEGVICSPEAGHVGGILRSFNCRCNPAYTIGKRCPSSYKCGHKPFEEFFPKAFCESCAQGVPLEIMLSIMHIESSGRCKVLNTAGDEVSAGLFQINSQVHSCGNNEPKTFANKKCFLNLPPHGILKYAVKILKEKYKITNNRQAASGKCPKGVKWRDLGPEEKDAWRFAVSAYNGGEKRVNRSKEIFQRAQKLLPGEPSGAPSFEDLRLFYLIRGMTTGDKKISQHTLNNLAHTEALLGREVPGAPPGIVAAWSKYIQDTEGPANCPATAPSCRYFK